VSTYAFRIANTISASLRHTAPYRRHEQLTVQEQKSGLSTPVIYKPSHTIDSTSRNRFKCYSTYLQHLLLTSPHPQLSYTLPEIPNPSPTQPRWSHDPSPPTKILV
jgi:hypothetical protein